jgi:hypothetical protein
VRAWQQHKVYSTYAELLSHGGAAGAEGGGAGALVKGEHDDDEDDDEDDTDDDTDQGNYYVPDTSRMVHDDEPTGYFAPYSKALAGRLNPEHEHEDSDKNRDNEQTAETATEMEWTVLEPTQQPQPAAAEQAGVRDHGYTDPEVYRILANVDADLVKAAVRRYAESLAPEEGEALLRHILGHVQAQTRQKIPIGGDEEDASDKPQALPELAKLPLSYGSKIFHAPAQPQQRFVSLSGQGAKSVSATPLARRTKPGGIGLTDSKECPVGDIGRRDKASVAFTKAPVVEKNTKWNENYQDLIATGIQGMSLASVKKLLRLANDFVYTCLTYTKVIVNELNMPNERKTIKPATDIGGLAGGEKYVIQGKPTTLPCPYLTLLALLACKRLSDGGVWLVCRHPLQVLSRSAGVHQGQGRVALRRQPPVGGEGLKGRRARAARPEPVVVPVPSRPPHTAHGPGSLQPTPHARFLCGGAMQRRVRVVYTLVCAR